jgi:hypothetical protein
MGRMLGLAAFGAVVGLFLGYMVGGVLLRSNVLNQSGMDAAMGIASVLGAIGGVAVGTGLAVRSDAPWEASRTVSREVRRMLGRAALGVVVGLFLGYMVGMMLLESKAINPAFGMGPVLGIASVLGAIGGVAVGAGLAVRLGAKGGSDSIPQMPSSQRRPLRICSGCGQANDPDAKYCNKCGSSLEQSAPNQPLQQTGHAITTPRPSAPPPA